MKKIKFLHSVISGLLLGAVLTLGLQNISNNKKVNAPVGATEVIFLPYSEDGNFYLLGDDGRLPILNLTPGSKWSSLPENKHDQTGNGVYAEFICRYGITGKYWRFQRLLSAEKKISPGELELQKLPGIIRIELPNSAAKANQLYVYRVESGEELKKLTLSKILNEKHPAHSTWIPKAADHFALYFDFSPENKTYLYTQYSILDNMCASVSPRKQSNEKIEDYVTDPTPMPLTDAGVVRCIMKYTAVPGQKIDPDLTKVLPGEAGFIYFTSYSEKGGLLPAKE